MTIEELAPVLKKSRWLLLRREQNLLVAEQIEELWDYKSATWAGKFLNG